MADNVPLSVDLIEVSREVAVAIQRCQAADAEKLAAYNALAEIGAAIKATEKDAAEVIAGFLIGGLAPLVLTAPPVAADPVVEAPVAADPVVEAPVAVDEPEAITGLVTEDTFQPPVEAPAAVAAEPEVVAVDEAVTDEGFDDEFVDEIDNIGANDE